MARHAVPCPQAEGTHPRLRPSNAPLVDPGDDGGTFGVGDEPGLGTALGCLGGGGVRDAAGGVAVRRGADVVAVPAVPARVQGQPARLHVPGSARSRISAGSQNAARQGRTVPARAGTASACPMFGTCAASVRQCMRQMADRY